MVREENVPGLSKFNLLHWNSWMDEYRPIANTPGKDTTAFIRIVYINSEISGFYIYLESLIKNL